MNLSWITDYYFDDFEDKEIINQGHCLVWAWIAHLAYPKAELVNVYDNVMLVHACVKIGRSYYDSDHPTGIFSPIQMKCIRGSSLSEHGDEDRIKHEIVHWSYFVRAWGRKDHYGRFRDQGLTPWPDVLPFYGPHRNRDRQQRTSSPARSRRSQRKSRSVSAR